MQLTRTERWALANQLRILEALYPDEREFLASQREVLENGYELEYDWICQNIYDETLSSDECIEVMNILDMYTEMKRAHQGLTSDTTIRAGAIAFPGFDGNYETKQLGYARHLPEAGKFVELDNGQGLNSHFPALEKYREMLKEWLNSPDKRNLTEKDLSRVISAQSRPQTVR